MLRRVELHLVVYACAVEDGHTRLWGGKVPWYHGKRWILTGRHSPRQGEQSARRGPFAKGSLILTGMERPTGGPGSRYGVRQRSKPHSRSCCATKRGAETVELSVDGPRAILRVPSSPSSWTRNGGGQGGCYWSVYGALDAVDIITANLKK